MRRKQFGNRRLSSAPEATRLRRLGLFLALKTIPVGTGYAVWTGIGAAGTAIVGMVM